MLALAAAFTVSLGCAALDGDAPENAFGFSVRVGSDDHSPIAGADVSFLGAPPAKTGATGEVVFDVSGREGERRALVVHCPQEYRSPETPTLVALHVLADPAKRPRYEVTCPRLTRTLVVAIRARGGANLPVLYLGHEIARTDAEGAAHALLRLGAGESFRLTLDTSKNDSLRPQNPSVQLAASDRDDILLFDQAFTTLAKERVVTRPRDPKPRRL